MSTSLLSLVYDRRFFFCLRVGHFVYESVCLRVGLSTSRFVYELTRYRCGFVEGSVSIEVGFNLVHWTVVMVVGMDCVCLARAWPGRLDGGVECEIQGLETFDMYICTCIG